MAEDSRERPKMTGGFRRPKVHRTLDCSLMILCKVPSVALCAERFDVPICSSATPLPAHMLILHISEVDVRETKMMGTTPIIILMFQTQQIYCVRDRLGSITEGGKDTIHTVYYAWALQQMEPDEVTEDAIYAMWRLRDMQQQGIKNVRETLSWNRVSNSYLITYFGILEYETPRAFYLIRS
ncbi:hypothetical protein Cgig2_002922 [Carnegiea gigantea]|uniref:Tim44-like domain-containing protein n=1 Tax=Carnegiea gigantea TaxID=171969 RepID=A0A9Q1JJF6_9CARY|nr:hypothetical protein Cgig2_002922 [Carnegiea gigantea]